MRDLSLLIKPASGNCNMRCVYCFYCDEMASREVANRGMMSLETLEIIVRKALEETEKTCSFGFQGGEPALMGVGFYEKVIEYQKKYNRNRVQIVNTIQTNGTLVDDNWARFFADYDFLVGLSIDGGKDTHDALRLDSEGKGTFNTCIKAANMLNAGKAEYNILSVVTRQLAAHPDKLWNFYKKHEFRYIQLIPCIDGINETPGKNRYSIDEKIFGKFLCRIFDLWYNDFTKGNYYSIRNFDNYVRMLMNEQPESCAMRGKCQSYALIEADGTVYPCDFYALDGYKIGDIHSHSFTDMLESETALRFIEPSNYILEECRACEYYFICRAGCRRDREPIIGGIPSLNRYCKAYKEFFNYTLPRMTSIAQDMVRRIY